MEKTRWDGPSYHWWTELGAVNRYDPDLDFRLEKACGKECNPRDEKEWLDAWGCNEKKRIERAFKKAAKTDKKLGLNALEIVGGFSACPSGFISDGACNI